MAMNIGRNIGAGRVREAKFYYRFIRLLLVFYSLVMAVIFFFFYDVLFSLFSDDETIMETLSITYYVITILMIFNLAAKASQGAVRSLGIQLTMLRYSLVLNWVF
jgi:Na+-driven multidrug efflux pump